jgi:GT2 family glycosyltransferase
VNSSFGSGVPRGNTRPNKKKNPLGERVTPSIKGAKQSPLEIRVEPSIKDTAKSLESRVEPRIRDSRSPDTKEAMRRLGIRVQPPINSPYAALSPNRNLEGVRFHCGRGEISRTYPQWNGAQIKLSILIPTLSSRSKLLSSLLERFSAQINNLKAHSEIEIVIFEDDRKYSVGAKRNKLIEEARGEFIVFVDDDDDVSDDYVAVFLDAIKSNPSVDFIGMLAIITFSGENPREVIYSLANKECTERDGVYYRPPSHLTPIRRSIASKYKFKEVNFGEDTSWSLQMVRDNAIKSEFFVDRVMYHYKFNFATSATQNQKNIAPKDPHPGFSIIILSAKPGNLKGCLESIFHNEPALLPSKVVVVDDGAGTACRPLYPNVQWIKGAKPFVYARNVNAAILKTEGDVILLNDDARLATRYGFTSMSYAVRVHQDIGVCSAAIAGVIGNGNQAPKFPTGMRSESKVLAFVCVYIPRKTISHIGLLDGRFIGYGFEDNDYCLRALNGGMKLMIYDGCVVEHELEVKSTFRSMGDISGLFQVNQKLFSQKWGYTQ